MKCCIPEVLSGFNRQGEVNLFTFLDTKSRGLEDPVTFTDELVIIFRRKMSENNRNKWQLYTYLNINLYKE